MVLTRDAIASGFIDRMLAAGGGMPDRWSIEQIRESYRQVLADAPKGDLWIFAYGSLIWNPTIHVSERRRALLRGYRRSFCLKTTLGRGTPEKPGLILGLEPGGACAGLVLKVDRAIAAEEFEILFRREMVSGSYIPRWVPVAVEGVGRRRAMAFVMNRRHARYVGGLSDGEVAATIAAAAGPLGKCVDYLDQTVAALAEHGIKDKWLTGLAKLVQADCAKGGS